MKLTRLLFIGFCVFFAGIGCTLSQTDPDASVDPKTFCHQNTKERDELINRAEVKEYNVLFVEILGNERTRGRDFFVRLGRYIGEGDIFKRKQLEAAIKDVSKMRAIRPISIQNVRIRLAEQDRRINISFCVQERSKKI